MDTISELVAKRYASALWAAVGPERSNEEMKSLDRFVEIYLSSEDLQKLFSNPAFSLEDKKKILTEISSKAKFSKDFQNFLTLLLERGRVSILGAICEAYKDKIMARDNVHTVQIETALPINETQQKKILASLEKTYGSKFVAAIDIVPDLVAGIRLHFLGQTIDATLTGVLFNMRQKIVALEN